MERERTSFPRFYFVGDEDLLEIIGNSKNIGRLQKHFKKMFAGVAALTLSKEDTVITGTSAYLSILNVIMTFGRGNKITIFCFDI